MSYMEDKEAIKASLTGTVEILECLTAQMDIILLDLGDLDRRIAELEEKARPFPGMSGPGMFNSRGGQS